MPSLPGVGNNTLHNVANTQPRSYNVGSWCTLGIQ